MLVESKIGAKKKHDSFHLSDSPILHEVCVKNRNGEECNVEVEIESCSPLVLVKNNQSWRSKKMTHGGLRSENPDLPYRAKLSFVSADSSQPQVIAIKIYMAAAWWSDDQPLPLVGELKHQIWVA